MKTRSVTLALATALLLTGCGSNTDLQRGETNCDSSSDSANNPHDTGCEETGNPDHNPD